MEILALSRSILLMNRMCGMARASRNFSKGVSIMARSGSGSQTTTATSATIRQS